MSIFQRVFEMCSFSLPYMTISKASQCRFIVYQLAQVLCPKGLCRPLEHIWRHICWCFWISYQGNMRNLLFWNAIKYYFVSVILSIVILPWRNMNLPTKSLSVHSLIRASYVIAIGREVDNIYISMLFSCFLSPILISIDSIWRPTTKDAWKQQFWIFSSIELTCYSTSINNNIDWKIQMFQNCEGIVNNFTLISDNSSVT